MENTNNINKTFQEDVYKVKHYLEKNCIGKENIKTYSEIMDDLFPEVNKKMYHGRFKKIIQILRINFDRKISSTCKGYYLPTNQKEEARYFVNQTITHIKTCLGQGVDKKIFYDVLNNTPCNNVNDGQGKLKLTPYAKEEVKRYTTK